VKAFCRGKIKKIERLLAETCHVQGPLGTWDNRDQYISELREDPPAGTARPDATE
jgi:hypothetical protein